MIFKSGILLFVSTLLLISPVLTSPALAVPIVGSDQESVALHTPTIEILFSDLTLNDISLGGAVSLASPPLRGELATLADRFVYTPNDSFWAVEIDSFVYRLSDATGAAEGTVALYASRLHHVVTHERFESVESLNSYPLSISGTGHTLTVNQAAQLEGSKGLEAHIEGGYAYVTLPTSSAPDQGGGPTGTGGGVNAGMGCIPDPSPDDEITLLALGGTPESPVADPPTLRLIYEPEGVVLQVRKVGGYASSQPVPLEGDRAFLQVEWWYDAGKISTLLRIDGLATTLMDVVTPTPDLDSIHLGLIATGPDDLGTDLTLAFDDVQVLAFNGIEAPPMLHSVRGFESGNTSDWPETFGSGFQVTAGSAASGEFGLEADVATGSYLVEDALAATPYLTAQVRLDLSQFSITHGDISTFYSFGSGIGTTTADTDLRLRFYGGAFGEPRILTTFASASGVVWSPVTAALPTGESLITVQYRAATSVPHPNGYLRVWVDDLPVIELQDLDSEGKQANWCHLGFYGSDPGTTGVVDFDDFVSAGR